MNFTIVFYICENLGVLNWLMKLGIGVEAFKNPEKVNKSFAFGGSEMPNYARLSDGTHSYNLEFERIGSWFSKKTYFRPVENYKYYYVNVPFLSDCIDLIADFASQVQIKEVHKETNEEITSSRYCQLLANPNPWQNQKIFIKEMVINLLTSGVSVQWGNYFKNGNLRAVSYLYNLEYNNLRFPKIKNPYDLRDKEIKDFVIIERLGNETRKIPNTEISIFYDRIQNSTYGKEIYKEENFFNPISRITSLLASLHTIINTEDSIAYLSDSPVDGIVSPDALRSELAPLGGDEKNDIELKLSGKGEFGIAGGKKKIIATNSALKYTEIGKDPSKLRMIEMQKNAKSNVQSKFNIPTDIFGTESSTYENQQFAEARFIQVVVKSITDAWLDNLTSKSPEYFTNTKLIGTYDHLPAVIEINGKVKNDGLKSKMEAFVKLIEAYEKAMANGIEIDYKEFMMKNGFDDLL